MIGLHSDLRGTYNMLYVLGEARGGTHKYQDASSSLGTSLLNTSPIKDNTLRAGRTGVGSWNGLYANILRVNLFIIKVETEVDFLTDAEKSYYLGQAYGIRAYYYFWLYRTYAGVPIVTDIKVLQGQVSAPDLYKARSTAKETLDFIKEDVNKSEAFFNGDFEQEKTKSMWSLNATLALKGEVYLWSAKVPIQDQSPDGTDATTAKDAISKLVGKYALESEFAKVFSEKGNGEIIMTIRFLEGESTNNYNEWISQPAYFLNIVADREGNVITRDTLKQGATGGVLRQEYKRGLFYAYEAADTRRDATFLDFYNIKQPGATWDRDAEFKGTLTRKNIGIVNSTNTRIYQGDISIYRYADVLLLMAEVENWLGADPSSYINQVRKRAYGANYVAVTHGYVNGDFATNEKAILFERDKEFVQEGKRWFDVVRMRDANKKPLVYSVDVNYADAVGETVYPILDEATQSHMLVWPIDETTLNKDPLVLQTVGY